MIARWGVWLGLGKLLFWNPKYTFNARQIFDRYLTMGFGIEA